MLRDELKPNLLMEIRPVELSNDASALGNKNDVYGSRLFRINTDDTLDIAIPTMNEDKRDLIRNTRYSFIFIYQTGTMKTAHGVFLQRIREDNVPMAKIKLVTPLKRIQRRDYYRLGCNIDMLFQVVRLREEDFNSPSFFTDIFDKLDEDADAWKPGKLLDISGGGTKFVSEAPIMDLPYVYILFKLTLGGEQKRIGISGKILDRQPVPRSLLCTYRVQFRPQTSKAQNDILAYIANQQTMMAKKDL